MSSLLYPNNIAGLTFDVTRSPDWKTGVQEAMAGKVSTIAYRYYPLVSFQLNYELLRDDLTVSDLRALVGLHNAVQGRFDTFLFQDPDFNAVTADSFGTGDGATTTFQLVAHFQNPGGPGWPEMVQNLNGVPTILDNGVAVASSSYSIGPTGIVTFTAAPASGHALTWTGAFYYRCRFDKDKYNWKKFLNKWWEAKSIGFTSVIL